MIRLILLGVAIISASTPVYGARRQQSAANATCTLSWRKPNQREDIHVRITICGDGQTLLPMGLGLSMVAALIGWVDGVCQIPNREPGSGVVVELMIPLAVPDSESYESRQYESAWG